MGESDDVYVLNDGYKHPKIGFGTYKVGFIPASASGRFMVVFERCNVYEK